MRAFGLACYLCLRPYQQQKFEFHSEKCVYIGYSDYHKGYLCLSLTKRVYVSRHVCFNELEFPFSSIFLATTNQINSLESTVVAWLPVLQQTSSTRLSHCNDDILMTNQLPLHLNWMLQLLIKTLFQPPLTFPSSWSKTPHLLIYLPLHPHPCHTNPIILGLHLSPTLHFILKAHSPWLFVLNLAFLNLNTLSLGLQNYPLKPIGPLLNLHHLMKLFNPLIGSKPWMRSILLFSATTHEI